MGQNSNVGVAVAAISLAVCCHAAQAASRPASRLPRGKASRPALARSASSGSTTPSASLARRGSTRLSAGARGPAGADTVEKAALEIPDLRTQANVASVIQALQDLKGVKTAVIDLNTHLAVVDYDPRVTELDHFLAACKEAGFDASEYRVESRFPKPIKLKGG